MSVSVYVGVPRGPADLLEFNMANGNFGDLMTLLGYEEQDFYTANGLIGEWTGARLIDLQKRVEFALLSLKSMPDLDAGTEEIRAAIPGFATLIRPGKRPGYWHDWLTKLLDLVHRAERTGQPLRYS